jgi:hypothetical protein
MKRLQKRLAQLEAQLRYGANKLSKSQLFGIVQKILVVEAAIELVSCPIVLATISPLTWTLEAQYRRNEGKKWVARIVGKDEKYTFKRDFLKASSIEWGKYGMAKAVFEIDATGFYQDSDGDYFKVFINEQGQFDAKTCSYMEVKEAFYHQLIAR